VSNHAQRRIKVLMVKPGLDSHWRGIQVVSRALRDAGMEIIYGGNQTYAGIARIALDEDVNVIGLSILAPGYKRLIDNTLLALKEADFTDALILVGGIILKEDVPALEQSGVDRVFLPGTPLDEIVDYVEHHAPARGIAT
jgi:methylmalonyl-CoA mutase cobalamin-binding domain/chain